VADTGPDGLDLVAGSGNVTLNGGSGADVFTGGSGSAVLDLGSGADRITFGNGGTTVSGGVADTFIVPVGCTGTATILNWTSQDSIGTPGFSTPAIVSDKVIGGSTFLGFQGGAQIELVGVSHFP
jgi:Ca2+-binding RTX toxin-like protein